MAPTATATEETKSKQLSKVKDLKVGDKWSRQSYGKVIGILPKSELGGVGVTTVEVENEHGLQWRISQELFEKEFITHDQFHHNEIKTRTELAEICMENPRVVMTICFKKQNEPNDVADALQEKLSYIDSAEDVGELIGNRRRWRKLIRDTMADNDRTLVGFHACTKDTGGRLFFTDMEVEEGSNVRKVDPRNIRWMIVNNVKYLVKVK